MEVYRALKYAGWFFTGTNIYGRKANLWLKGRTWIDGSETIWNSLIRTTRSEPQTYWVSEWVPCSTQPEMIARQTKVKKAASYIIAPDPNCGSWETVSRTRYVSVSYPSDGFIPEYSQEIQNIPAGNKYYIEGANHEEVKNMSRPGINDNTKAEFNKIFNRNDVFHVLSKLSN